MASEELEATLDAQNQASYQGNFLLEMDRSCVKPKKGVGISDRGDVISGPGVESAITAGRGFR